MVIAEAEFRGGNLTSYPLRASAYSQTNLPLKHLVNKLPAASNVKRPNGRFWVRVRSSLVPPLE